MENILYITDDKADLKSFTNYLRDVNHKERPNFYICPITVNNDLVSLTKKGLSKYGKTKVLPFIEEFNKNAFSYRDKFIKFLSDFSSGDGKGLISLRKYFIHPFGRFSLWWFSLVQEKSTLKKPSYHNLAKLITIIGFQCDYSIDRIYIDIENNALKKSIFRNRDKGKIPVIVKSRNKGGLSLLISFIKALGYVVFFIIRKCILSVMPKNGIKKRMSGLGNTRFLFITYFPFSDENALKKNVFKSRYFGPLQTSIEKRYGNEISWIGLLQNNAGLNIGEIKLVRKINAWGYSIFMQEELISFREIVSSFFIFIYMAFKFLIKIPYLSGGFIFDCGKKINIWDLFREDWIYSFFGTYLIGNLFRYRIFLNVISRIQNGALIIYPSEFQAWENALNFARGKDKKVKTVGIQHTTLPLLVLNFFNAPRDFETRDSIDAFPIPDYLATSGNIPMRLLTQSGWPKEGIFDIGALRYHRLSKFLKKEIDWRTRKKQAVVALSVVKEEAKEMLLVLWQAFRNNDICTFVIKPHPACPIRDIVEYIGFDASGGKFIFDTGEPLEDLLLLSRAVIVGGSSAVMEGIACQCPVIIPRLSCVADMNPLSGISQGLARYVANQDELRDAVGSIVNSEESPVEFNKFKLFINDYFTFHDSRDEYFIRLSQKSLLTK